ncbi:uncharacterized protein LOC114516242 [Dendronephthya gigantea]|uniref:uncharacterized protein LOC114516242 n=1 Tax=Dendronephthya gigantea TaxID=151771 RepID=UPI00106B277F|nr:uncharacterized protein LOC114516242 [Dendronephthya gigantea]
METGRQSRQKTDSQRIRLAEAISNGRLYQTKMILNDFTNLDYLDDEELSPLMRAFMIEDAKHRTRSAMVKLLIQHKADVNFQDKHGQNVLNWACKANKLDLVRLLLEKCLQDIDPTTQDLEGNTPLIYAVMNNNVNMVKLLVSVLKKYSLSVDHRNKLDQTAYLKALELGFDECASILSEVGRASLDIKVNPFLEFLAVPDQDVSRKMRVRSAPLTRGYGIGRGENRNSEHFKVNRQNDTIFHPNKANLSREKKLGNRLFKSRKIHSVVSRKSQNENSKKVSQKSAKRDKSKVIKNTDLNGKISIGDENLEIRDLTVEGSREHTGNEQMEDLKASKKEENSGSKRKDHLLRLLLDETQNPDIQRLPRDTPSNTSCSQVSSLNGGEIKRNVPTVNGYFSCKQAFDNDESSRNGFANYHSYLEWKASLDHPPNTLRSFLALRAEQHSEKSSYRKGIVLPKHDPTSEDSDRDRSFGATSPVSERSGKSEAGRKISAVAKTVGLSIYLTNKRKNSTKT